MKTSVLAADAGTSRLKAYTQSFYTRMGIALGGVMYLSYAAPTGEWSNRHLLGIAGFTGLFLPTFVSLSDVFERTAIGRTGSMFLGKAARFGWQFLFNLLALETLIAGAVVDPADLRAVGGVLGAVTLMSLASQGVQYLMIEFVNRDIGNRYLNVFLALSLNICVGALAALGFEPVQVIFVLLGLVLGFVGAGYSLVSDLLGVLAPPGGVGVFFGTFNPVHVAHLRILREFIERRGLDRVYVHPTVVPRFYQALLDEGVIEIAEMKDGMRVYRKTGRGDLHIDYFPTGTSFFEVENRVALLHAAVADAGLADRVTILHLPETYRDKGFRGVIAHVRRLEPGKRVHGLHGSDYGGVVVRMIYDSAFVIPYPVIRRDSISATAIRSGGKGMTTETVDRILRVLADDHPKREGELFTFHDRSYVYRDHRLLPLGHQDDGRPEGGERPDHTGRPEDGASPGERIPAPRDVRPAPTAPTNL